MSFFCVTFDLFNYNDNEPIFVEVLGEEYKMEKKQKHYEYSKRIYINPNLAVLYYKYTKRDTTEVFQYKSISFYYQENIKVDNFSIRIYDKWDKGNAKSSFHPIMQPIFISDKFNFYFLYTQNMNDSHLSHSPQIIFNNSKYAIKKSKDHFECSFNISSIEYFFEVPELNIRIPTQFTYNESILYRFDSGIYMQRFASIYLPLISFKAINFGCDVGTFSSIKRLVDFCNKCGIYQIILDIEKVNDDFIIDPIHYDCFFNANELTTYDIDSIRNQKLIKLKEESEANEQFYDLCEFYKIYSKITKMEYNGNENIIYAQYKCISQLQEAYIYACKKNVSISTVVINDENVYNKVQLASLFSHSVYICNPFKKRINKEVYKKIDNCGLTIITDSLISKEIKNDNLSFIIPHKNQPRDEFVLQSTYLGPETLVPALISEFPEKMSQRDIKHAIEERIYSEADVSIIYLTDLLYITLPGAERSLYQPLRGKIDKNDQSNYWRYLYNFSVSDLIEDQNVIRKTQALLKNGNRYYEEKVDDD